MRDAEPEDERKEKALRYARAVALAIENPEMLKDDILKEFVEEVKRMAERCGDD